MPVMVPLHDRSGMSEGDRARLVAAIGRFQMLEDVVRWGFGRSPPADVAEVVVQDEFTHDVVLPWEGESFLVFDTT